MRGAVALAAALAIPLTVEGGDAFPGRELVIFLAFSTIVATLVLQGLTLPPLVRVLGVEGDGRDEEEEVTARRHTAEAALARVEELAEADWTVDDTIERVRGMFGYGATASPRAPTATGTRRTSNGLPNTCG
jgi:monovalent cation/hydrogen antiporter